MMTDDAGKCVWRVSHELLKYFRQDGEWYVSGQLRVIAEVANLGPVKTVGLRYTLDNWAAWKEINGIWSRHCRTSDTDQFVICSESTLPPGTLMRYAIYYIVNGSMWWDNNNSRNYSAQF